MKIAMEGSLLVFVDKGNNNDLGVENQFNEVCDPLEAGVWTGIPDIEPKSGVVNSPIYRFGWTKTVNIPVQRSAPFDFVRRVWGNQVTKFIEHRFLLHRARTKTRALRR